VRRGALALALLALLATAGRARAGDPSRDALGRLRTYQQRTRLQDLQTDAQRRLESLRAPGHPVARDRTERRWRTEDRQTDFQRDREREAIERRLDVEQRLERAAEPRSGPAPPPAAAADAAASRAAFDRELAEVEQRERLERMRRDAASRAGPGVQRWPRSWPR